VKVKAEAEGKMKRTIKRPAVRFETVFPVSPHGGLNFDRNNEIKGVNKGASRPPFQSLIHIPINLQEGDLESLH